MVAVLIFAIFCPVGTARGLFDWLNDPVTGAGIAIALDPGLAHTAYDPDEAVDIALGGLMWDERVCRDSQNRTGLKRLV